MRYRCFGKGYKNQKNNKIILFVTFPSIEVSYRQKQCTGILEIDYR